MRLPLFLALGTLSAASAAAAEFDCLIEAKRTIAISGPVEALIANVRVDRGDLVRKGDVLIEFDAGVERASAELARQRAELEGSIQAREARNEFAGIKAKRRRELVKENYISQQDADEAEAERRLAEAELREARDGKRLAELEHRRASELLRQRVLTSPVNGVVLERLMHPGEVSELGRKPILRIADISTLNVEVVLPLAAYRQVQRGDVALVRPEQPIGGQYEAKVVVVDRLLDPASGTFGARLDLPNAGSAIPAGVRCRVEFPKVSIAAKSGAPRPPAAAGVR